MFFITTLYCPDFKSKPYLTLIEQKLKHNKTLDWKHEDYLRLLNLKKYTSQAAASFSQIERLFAESDLVKNRKLEEFEKNLLRVVHAAIANQDTSFYEDQIRNSFSLIKDSMAEDSEIRKSFSILNLVTNSITTAVALTGICIAAFAISTGGIGAIALGLGLALVATAIGLLAAYSLYVDGRYVANKQVEDIDSFIDTLFAYKGSMVKSHPVGSPDNSSKEPIPRRFADVIPRPRGALPKDEVSREATISLGS